MTAAGARRGRLRTTRASPNSSETHSTGRRAEDGDGARAAAVRATRTPRRAADLDEDEEGDRIDTVGETERLLAS